MLIRRELAEWQGNPKPCRSPEHNPPMFMVYENGDYEWECDTCGHIQYFTVRRPKC